MQDDWSALLPTTGWNHIESMTVNGINVQVQARPIGGASVPIARIRGIATVHNRTRVVEYTIRMASFADYALYFGATNTVGIGPYFKMVGTFYSRGSINLQNGAGIEFFGDVTTSGTIVAAPDPVYNFKKGYVDNHPIIQIPPTAYGMAPMLAAAQASSTLFYGNTLAITLVEDKFIRSYRYRLTGSGGNYVQTQYEIRTEVLDIPDESVIYIMSQKAPYGVDVHPSALNQYNHAQEGVLELSGVLDYARVTVACEHVINIPKSISYRSLLNNPDLRRMPNKKTDQALAFREMLGVLSNSEIGFITNLWTPLPSGQIVTNITGDTGHHDNQFTLDGVFMGVNKAQQSGGVGSSTNRELWVTGGIINGNAPTTALAAVFDRRNYDTDYRLQMTLPPYFLRAYGTTAVQVTGSWRTYEL